MTIQELLERARGAAGRKVDQVGSFLGNPLPEKGWSERAEAAGGSVLGTQDRINTSLQNTGAIAEGDYATAQKMGIPLAPSRADGGILNRPQMAQNSSAVDQYLKSQGVTDVSTLNPVQQTQYNNLRAGVTAPSGIDINGLIEAQRQLARDTYSEGVRRAGDAFNRAKGVYDEGVGLLGQRKAEFQKLFQEGQDNILDRYEGERGNLQASSQGAETRSANALRAMGLGGSAMIKSQGRQTQNNARAAGELATMRNQNDNANKGAFDERQTWARTQDAALQRSLQDAADARTAAENQAGLIERGDYQGITNNVNSYLQQLAAQQNALAASTAGIGGYSATPTAVNIADMTGAVGAVTPQMTGGAQPGSNMGVSLDEQAKQMAMLRKQAGGNMYGLRA